MTRIAYMGGEPMKYKCVMVVALSVFACFGGIATNSPLSLLRNKWGKGSIVDFRKVAYENLPLLFDEGGTVALDLDVLPEGADELLSVIYKVRRLRGNGTYTDWEYAAGNYWGKDAIYNPSDGGIYQVQALAGLGWGAEDERYYRWEEDENSDYGIKRTGDFKAFGVCDDEWQKSLRNCAKGHLGTRKFALMESLAGEYGFSGIPEKKDKCNYFVAYAICESGLPLIVQYVSPLMGNLYPPAANDWANGDAIQHWQHLGRDCFIQPGYVMGHPAGRHGHCGVVDFDGVGISAGSRMVRRTVTPWDDGTTGFNKLGGDN